MSDNDQLGTRARGPGRGASMTTAEAEAFRAGRAEGYAAGVQTWAVERAAAYRAGAEAMREAAALVAERFCVSREGLDDIRALPLPEAPK